MLWSVNRLDRLTVFQRITPPPNDSTSILAFVCLTFALASSLRGRAKPDDATSFPARCFTVSVLFFLLLSRHSFWSFYDFTVVERRAHSRIHSGAHCTPEHQSGSFSSFFFSVLVVDLRDSIVNFTAQRVSVCIRHFVLAKVQSTCKRLKPVTPCIPALCFCSI